MGSDPRYNRPRVPPIGPYVIRLVLSVLIVSTLITLLMKLNSRQAPELTEADKALSQSNLVKASAELDSYLSGRPEVTGYTDAIRLCLEHGHADLAVKYGLKGTVATKTAPALDRAQIWSGLAEAYSVLETTRPQTQALAAAAQAYHLDQNDPRVLNEYGYILVDNNQDLDEGLELITRALRAASDNPLYADLVPEAEDSYGWALYRKGQYPAAVDALNRAIHDLSEDSTPGAELKVSYYHLGAAYRAMGRTDDARIALQTALFYDSTYADAQKEIALLPPLVKTASVSPAPKPAPPGSATSVPDASSSSTDVPHTASPPSQLAAPVNSAGAASTSNTH